MGSDLLRIRTVREPNDGTSRGAGLALVLSILVSAVVLVPTTLAVLWVLGDDGEVTGSVFWGVLLLSATLAGMLNVRLVRSVDAGSSRAEQVVTAGVGAVLGTGLGVLLLFFAFIAMLPGEG